MSLAEELRVISKQNAVEPEAEIQKLITESINAAIQKCRYTAKLGNYHTFVWLYWHYKNRHVKQIIAELRKHGLKVSRGWFDRKELWISWDA